MTLIKWPGGKSREIKEFEKYIPAFNRYIEPMVGGGAVFFYLSPKKALINDISTNLMMFYKFVKEQDSLFKTILLDYHNSFSYFYNVSLENIKLLELHYINQTTITEKEISSIFDVNKFSDFIPNTAMFLSYLTNSMNDKIRKLYRNNQKKPMNDEDIHNNLLTGITSGYYLYFRKIYNDIQLNTADFDYTHQYKAANFYWIREYCYGSMFRYNKNNLFNIPYGGISYNKKNFLKKINEIFNDNMRSTFESTELYNNDFESFLNSVSLKEDDFIFLDPPYDTNFSDYENRSFDQNDQVRLRDFLITVPSKFMLVIKNTEFIFNLYNNEHFNFINFEKKYTYNVRSRNDRNVSHLIITNYKL